MSDLNNILRLKSHENRTKTGRVSTTMTRKIANYLALGRGRPAQQQQRQPRGVWLDQDNKVRSHEDVIAWVQSEGKAQRYTHQLILSVKDEWLTPEAYNRALAAGGAFFDEWHLMAHTDTAYSHAHVIAFGDDMIRFKSETFRSWWLTVRQALEAERQAAIVQRTAVQEQALARQPQLERATMPGEALDLAQEEQQAQQADEAAWEMEW